jgi:hypothetical protein
MFATLCPAGTGLMSVVSALGRAIVTLPATTWPPVGPASTAPGLTSADNSTPAMVAVRAAAVHGGRVASDGSTFGVPWDARMPPSTRRNAIFPGALARLLPPSGPWAQ